jgi:hypothetical protein
MRQILETITYLLPTLFFILILLFGINFYILIKKYILLKIKYYEKN